jgi:ubiquinone biosynthesis protein COQ9
MPKAKKTKATPFEPTDVFAACFNILALKGLGKVRLSAIAEELDVPFEIVHTHYPSVESILQAFADHIDQAMMDQVMGDSLSSKRELYFDMIMARFDQLQAHRSGTTRWIKELVKHPDLWRSTLCRMEQSISLMLDIAKDSPRFPVKKLGITAIYLTTLRAWLEDDTEDMAKTMAALDTALGRGEMVIKRFMSPKKPKAA